MTLSKGLSNFRKYAIGTRELTSLNFVPSFPDAVDFYGIPPLLRSGLLGAAEETGNMHQKKDH